jgi:uncharacterized protein (TIGR02246 family)
MNRYIFIVCAIEILCPQNGTPTMAQEGRPSELREKEQSTGRNADRDDLSAIRRESQAFVEEFNRADAKAVAMLWTADGDYIDQSGRKFQGRAAIEKEYADFFSQNRGVKIRIVIDSLRVIGSDVAVEDGRAILDPVPAGTPATSKYTVVHAKIDGKWQMATVRDSRVERQSAYGNIADLEWLIGTWTAEEHGSKSESVCRWVANKSFVERSYSTTQPDCSVLSGVQIIGWNPERGCVQSWNFSADGGHAIGIWTPRERGWSAELRGMTGDGTSTTAVNLLTRLDDNTYVWQSIQRTIGGRTLPDTDEVVLKRRTTDR